MRLGELRRLVSIEEVLRRRGLLDGLVHRGQRLVGPCPVHGGENPTAFVVDCRRGLWNCFTRCRGGDVVELVRALDGTSYAEVARTLASMVGQVPANPPEPSRLTHPATTAPAAFVPYTRSLTLDPDHSFLAARGICPNTARRFEVGAWQGRGMLQGCVAVRLHDALGRPIGYAGRRLRPDGLGKWVFPRGFPKAGLLYGWHRLGLRDEVVVVEGAWEVLRLHQLGVPAVALLGTACGPRQAAMLRGRPCRILLDGDDAGQAAAHQIGKLLGAPVLPMPPGRDPADLDDPGLLAALTAPPL